MWAWFTEVSCCWLQDRSRTLNLLGDKHNRVGREVIEHAVRLACASLIRQSAEKGISAMLYIHGQASEPSLERLMDFTIFAAAALANQLDSCGSPSGSKQSPPAYPSCDCTTRIACGAFTCATQPLGCAVGLTRVLVHAAQDNADVNGFSCIGQF